MMLTTMNNEMCDRHPSARAQARIILPSGGVLFACGHCARTLDFGGEFLIEYAEVLING
jgi:hypothetical protein